MALLAVLANDAIAPDAGETLFIAAVTQGTHGAVTITGAGSGLTYRPNNNYFGSDTFTYTISDGHAGEQRYGMVTVTVTPVNDPPTAGPPDAFTVAEDPPRPPP